MNDLLDDQHTPVDAIASSARALMVAFALLAGAGLFVTGLLLAGLDWVGTVVLLVVVGVVLWQLTQLVRDERARRRTERAR